MKPRAPAEAPPGAPRAPAAAAFLPREHGSWSLALEPMALGLLAAPSAAGAAVAAAILGLFFARRPMRAALEAAPPRARRPALLALAILAVVAAAGLAEACALSGVRALWPLAPAAVLGCVFLWFDARGEARAAAAEIAGAAAFSIVPAALASAAGWGPGAALALAALMLARSVPTVLTVRAFLRLAKGRPAGPAAPVLCALLALALAVGLARSGLAPAAAPALAAVLAARTVCVFTPLRPAWTARRVGLAEMGLGAAYVAVLALAYRH